MIIGYARVSTVEQNLDAQLKALEEAGATKIYQDKKSGKDMHREGLQEMLSTLKAGDTLVITKIDRIARTIKGGIELIEELTSKGIKLHILNMGLFDGSPTSKLIMNVLLSVAEFEREIMLERQREGIAIAKANGKYKTKPKKYHDNNPGLNEALEKLANRKTNGKTVKQICEENNVTRSSLYAIAKERGIL
ncbi:MULTISPECIES: recombinase family protein [unclassified Bacillus cereus group]|uniref:recombinase family protein n=1 Tax=unclassified Bacillus cereus group TaxID=2750818 RepID=UPI0024C64DE0|nr:MAG: recombinase family protein [Bacillus paranthracis]WAI34421.1 MAG: recombinase family protein [Bacillus paranthracis]WAI37454.1 MAG: recombinase family protein [Bacillus paranthracis]